jgi:hypothetical protein
MAQELRREPPVRLPNPSAQPFVIALKTARFFAVIFFWVTMVCILAHVAAFVLTEWAGLYDVKEVSQQSQPAPKAAPAPAPASVSWSGFFENTAMAQDDPGALFSPRHFGTPSNTEPEEPTSTQEPLLAPVPPASTAVTPPTPAPAPTVTPPPKPPEKTIEQQREQITKYMQITEHILGPARIVAVPASILLAVTLLLYLLIVLVGRLGGIRHLVNALFLLLIFIAMVLPWDNIFAPIQVSALYNFDQLHLEHTQRLLTPPDIWANIGYFWHFFVMPALSVLVLAWSGMQFARGYKESVLVNR